MSRFLPLAVAVPLLGAAVSLAIRSVVIRRALAVGGICVTATIGMLALAETADGSVIVSRAGGFPRPFAISFVADTFAALMLVVFASVALACLGYAAVRAEDRPARYHVASLALVGAATGAVLTGDLFNLFVWIEVLLLASYVLLTIGSTPRRVRVATLYVATNLLGSTVFLAGVALVYATAGTVNLGALRGAAASSPSVAIGALLVVVALGVKAALVPVHAWLPRAYPEAPAGVTALFSGTLTKVGIVAMFRVVTLVFEGDSDLGIPLLVVAAATMVVGVIGAVGRTSMRGILAFHMVSQMGYLVMALGLGSVAAMTAGIFFLAQYIGVKTGLFLVAGVVIDGEGSDELEQLGGLARSRPALTVVFGLVALSLAGFPPLSGFVGKFGLVQAAFAQGGYVIGTVALAVSALTLVSMVKIWTGAFWGSAPEEPTPGPPRPGLLVPAAFMAVGTVVLGLGADVLWSIAERAAEGLVDPAAYASMVAG